MPGENVLVVTHEGVLNAVRAAFEGIDVAAYHGTYRNGHEMVLRARVAGGHLIDVGVLPPFPGGRGVGRVNVRFRYQGHSRPRQSRSTSRSSSLRSSRCVSRPRSDRK